MTNKHKSDLLTDRLIAPLTTPSSAFNTALRAFAAERRRLLSTDISCCRGTQQQTPRRPLLWWVDGTDRRTDTQPVHKPCSAYYSNSANRSITITFILACLSFHSFPQTLQH